MAVWLNQQNLCRNQSQMRPDIRSYRAYLHDVLPGEDLRVLWQWPVRSCKWLVTAGLIDSRITHHSDVRTANNNHISKCRGHVDYRESCVV